MVVPQEERQVLLRRLATLQQTRDDTLKRFQALQQLKDGEFQRERWLQHCGWKCKLKLESMFGCVFMGACKKKLWQIFRR